MTLTLKSYDYEYYICLIDKTRQIYEVFGHLFRHLLGGALLALEAILRSLF